jgi:hypothetical protein
VTLAVGWALLPLALGLLSLGCGLLLETASATRLPGALLLPAGFAVIVVAAPFAALSSRTASLAAPLAVALAVTGFGTSTRLRSLRPDGWAAGAFAAAYAVYAAPVVLSGRATFAGYIKLDDTATYFAMLDRVEIAGHSLAGLAPSTYEATLDTSLAYGYPIGSFGPLGVAQRLLRTDVAWLWQPYLAFLAAALALALYALAAPVVASRPARATIAFVACQPAILFGYYLWGGIKELAAALMLAVLAATIPVLLKAPTVRAAVPAAVSTAALVDVLSLGGAGWLAVLLAVPVLVLRARGRAFALRATGLFAATAVACAVPAIAAAVEWLPHSGAFTSADELGNLIRPLRLVQIAGIWPTADFRSAPHDLPPTYVLVAVVMVAAVGGVLFAWSRRAWGLLVYLGGALVGVAVFDGFGSPWVGGKALATAAPALLLLALCGAAALAERGRATEAALLAAAVIGGVGWSNVRAYGGVWLAPSARLDDLGAIGKRYAGDGPALMTEFDPYGARHFLRSLDAEGASELRRHEVPLRSGQPLPPQAYADIDRFELASLLGYRLLVLRRSPLLSRPPSPFRLVERRRWYEVWMRDDSAPRVLEHLPLGNELSPGAVPSCAAVLRLASLPGVRRLVAVPRDRVAVLSLSALERPASWTTGNVAGSIDPGGSGSVSTSFRATPGRYDVWLEGSFLGRFSVAVDGRPVGSARHELEWSGQLVDLGTVRLVDGAHRIELRYAYGGWRPGTHGLAPFPAGPLVIAPTAAARLVDVAPARAKSLCGRRLDWVEAVA